MVGASSPLNPTRLDLYALVTWSNRTVASSHHRHVPTESLLETTSSRVPNNEARQSRRGDWMARNTLADNENGDYGWVARQMADGDRDDDSLYLILGSHDLMAETYTDREGKREKTKKVVLVIS
ncbi:hypothetical protein ACFE04_000090 [Oxalis oulophora]